MTSTQVFEQAVEGRVHRVVASASTRHHVMWFVDGEEVAAKRSFEDKLRLEHELHGSVVVRYSWLDDARTATWHAADDALSSHAGTGGVDLEPEPGSKAAAVEQRMRDHPTRYAVIQTLGGVGKVVVPIVVALIAARLLVQIPWPDIPWPDWSIPWPDLPSIPWPDWSIPSPDWSVPGWLRTVAQYAPFVVPVIVAYVLARARIRRRRDQDAKRQR